MPDGRTSLTKAGSVVFAATPTTVRHTLADLQSIWRAAGIDRTTRDTAEQVLAEVLNNAVEHALDGCDHRTIELTTTYRAGRLSFQVRDNGRTMPNGKLPIGDPANLDRDLQHLPEGGFGWFLIRSLTEELSYCRQDGWNCLRFQVQPAHQISGQAAG